MVVTLGAKRGSVADKVDGFEEIRLSVAILTHQKHVAGGGFDDAVYEISEVIDAE